MLNINVGRNKALFDACKPLQEYSWIVDKIRTYSKQMAVEDAYLFLVSNSKPEEARCVLPLSLKTELVMTANIREWRHFFNLRVSPFSHPQMRQVTILLLKELKERIPIVFDDIEFKNQEI